MTANGARESARIVVCRACLTHGAPRQMEKHFRSHANQGEPIPDVPREPALYYRARPNGTSPERDAEIARRAARSPEQVVAERWANHEALGRAPHEPIRKGGDLEAAGRAWLARHAKNGPIAQSARP